MTTKDTMDVLTGFAAIALCLFSGFAYAGEKITLTCSGTTRYKSAEDRTPAQNLSSST
jgi:hypothetical protein